MERLDRLAFGKGSKITLGVLIPAHSCYGMLPPTLHRFQGTAMRLITLSDHFFQMLVLPLYHLVSGIAMEREIAWSTYCLHVIVFINLLSFRVFGRQLGRVETDERSRRTSPRRRPSQPHPRRSGLRDPDEVARGITERAVARAPGLGRRLLEYLGARRTDLLEGRVEVVGPEDRRLQGPLRHE